MFETVIALIQLLWFAFTLVVIFAYRHRLSLRYIAACGMVVCTAIDIARTAFHQDWGWMLFNVLLLLLWAGYVRTVEKHLVESPSRD